MLIAMVQFPASYLIHVPRYDVSHLTMGYISQLHIIHISRYNVSFI